MRSVVFKRISIQNFLSIGEVPLEFDYQPGVNLVTGHNHDSNSRNGIGKSAVFADALFFALFGQTVRPLTKPRIANRRTDGQCRVQLEFDVVTPEGTDKYCLLRTLKPSKLHLTKNGEDISININKSTEELNRIINATPDVFRNCVIMSLNTTLPFMLQSKVDKRKFIEGILRLDVFSSMLLGVRKLITEHTREVDARHIEHQQKLKTVEAFREQQRRQNEQRKQQIAELKSRIEGNEAKIDELLAAKNQSKTLDIVKIRGDTSKIKEQQDKSQSTIQTLIGTQARLTEQINTLNRTIDNIRSKPKSCPMCRRPFETHDQSLIEQELQALIDQRGTLDGQLTDVEQYLTTQNSTLKKCKTAIQRLTESVEDWRKQEAVKETCDAQIQQLREFVEHCNADIQALTNSQDQMQESINAALLDASTARSALDDAQFDLSVLETCRFIVSEEGVKSYIIKKMLKMFNSRLAYYLTKLNSNCRCTFNEYFEETIIDELGNETCYSNYSGGECKRIDLAMLFTFQDIRRLQADSAINVCIYDELFDSSLDQSGVMAVLELLKERSQKYGESTYVITHRSESLKMVDDVSIVHLEKRDGITQIAQYETTI